MTEQPAICEASRRAPPRALPNPRCTGKAPTTAQPRKPGQPPRPAAEPRPASPPGQVHPTARSKLFPRPRINPSLPASPPEVPHAEPNWNQQRLLHPRSPQHTATSARSESCAERPRQKLRPSTRRTPTPKPTGLQARNARRSASFPIRYFRNDRRHKSPPAPSLAKNCQEAHLPTKVTTPHNTPLTPRLTPN